jgi:hypothetical protein
MLRDRPVTSKQGAVMKHDENKLGSIVEARLNSIRLTSAERETAITAIRNAGLVVDAFVSVAEKIRGVGASVTHKPTVAH